MSLFTFFGISPNRKSAKIARERLQIVVSHRPSDEGDPNFLPKLRHELLTVISEVISKYVKVDQNQISVQLQRNGGCSVLELNIALPTEGTTPTDEIEMQKAT